MRNLKYFFCMSNSDKDDYYEIRKLEAIKTKDEIEKQEKIDYFKRQNFKGQETIDDIYEGYEEDEIKYLN